MDLFGRLESQYGLPSGLLDAVWSAESGRGRAMQSPAGAQGHFQFMPTTAKQYGVDDPHDLAQSAAGAARMYSDLLKQTGGDLSQALAAYNWGIGNLQRKGMESAPAETRNYIQKVTTAMGQPQARADDSDDWTALAKQFGQPSATDEKPAADPWADLAKQFAQPAVQEPQGKPSAVASTPTAAARTGPGGGVSRTATLAAIPVIGPAMAAMDIGAKNLPQTKGVLGGLAEIGNTIINRGTKSGADVISAIDDPLGLLPDRLKRPAMGITNIVTGQKPMSQAEKENAERSEGLKRFMAENDSPEFTTGRIAGNILGTWPVGGVLAAPLKTVPRLAPLADSVASGGFRTGLAPTTVLGRAGDLGLRAAGGAVTGGASAGLVDPASAGLGAGIGGLTPPGIRALGSAGRLTARVVRGVTAPANANTARDILAVGGYRTPEEIAAVRSALTQQGPRIVPEPPTVSQILQNPEISQLERTVRNAPGGAPPLVARDQAKNAARLGVLDDIAPIAPDLPQARTDFGNTIAPRATEARNAASKQVREAFDAVDPMDETRFYLPIPEMEASKAKFLGSGTFGTGSKAGEAIATAKEVGTETLPAVTVAQAPGARRQGQTLLEAVKSLGGIKQDSKGALALAGEIRDLKQAGGGMRTIIQNGRGQSPDTIARAMHAQGFIPDADPATLLAALRVHAGGQKIYSTAADRSGTFRAGMEAAQGEAPGAEVVRKAVPFQTVQNLRSSLGEAAAFARSREANKEAAALESMIGDLDARVNAVAAGRGEAAEAFPADIVDQWRKAIALHADKQDRFARGPQAFMFRKGQDGNYSVEGGELAPKFFSSRASQAEDIEALKRMGLGKPVTDSLKSYATTDAARRVTGDGTLKAKAFEDWRESHGGAIRGLFSEGEQARLAGVGIDATRAAAARDLGRATGSDTAQNIQSALGIGLLDNRGVNAVANRIPFVGRFTGPALDMLRESARKTKAERLGGLLANPDELDQAIAAYLSRAGRPTQGLLEDRSAVVPFLLRSGPLLATDPS